MTEIGEIKPIATKLLQKTRERKIVWNTSFESSPFGSSPGEFKCSLGDSFKFLISRLSSGDVFLKMLDSSGNSLLTGSSTSLPTSPEEESFSEILERLYELARRQVFKVDEKVKVASELLDRA